MSNCPFMSSINEYHYWLINTSMSWTDAQLYCREKYTDLVTIESEKDTSRLPTVSTRVWIGLSDHPDDWKWSDGSTSTYRNWNNLRDNFNSTEHCALLFPSTTWADANCNSKYPFICQEGKFSMKASKL
uniref:C-type lectin domain-containing protein n=1 Tax=Periophthalmus magnuspinnatus TaxID=409849 RepID=A0A3B3ZW41_9GOBI